MSEIVGGVGDLLSRLKRDGVEAGEAERLRILAEARTEAEQIVAVARAEAKRAIEEASAQRESQIERMNAELKLAARDFVAGFHQRISREVVRPLVQSEVAPLLQDPAFLAKVLGEILIAWATEVDAGPVEAVVDEAKRAAIEGLFTQRLVERMDAGKIHIEGQRGHQGFRLAREGDTFVWDVTLDAVASELASLVDPVLRGFVTRDVDEEA